MDGAEHRVNAKATPSLELHCLLMPPGIEVTIAEIARRFRCSERSVPKRVARLRNLLQKAGVARAKLACFNGSYCLKSA